MYLLVRNVSSHMHPYLKSKKKIMSLERGNNKLSKERKINGCAVDEESMRKWNEIRRLKAPGDWVYKFFFSGNQNFRHCILEELVYIIANEIFVLEENMEHNLPFPVFEVLIAMIDQKGTFMSVCFGDYKNHDIDFLQKDAETLFHSNFAPRQNFRGIGEMTEKKVIVNLIKRIKHIALVRTGSATPKNKEHDHQITLCDDVRKSFLHNRRDLISGSKRATNHQIDELLNEMKTAYEKTREIREKDASQPSSSTQAAKPRSSQRDTNFLKVLMAEGMERFSCNNYRKIIFLLLISKRIVTAGMKSDKFAFDAQMKKHRSILIEMLRDFFFFGAFCLYPSVCARFFDLGMYKRLNVDSTISIPKTIVEYAKGECFDVKRLDSSQSYEKRLNGIYNVNFQAPLHFFNSASLSAYRTLFSTEISMIIQSAVDFQNQNELGRRYVDTCVFSCREMIQKISEKLFDQTIDRYASAIEEIEREENTNY